MSPIGPKSDPKLRAGLEDDETLEELPPMDGGDEQDAERAPEELEVSEDAPADLDDSTGEEDPIAELAVEGSEGGWLDDAAEASDLDVGADDVIAGAEGEDLLRDADEPGTDDEVLDVGQEGTSIAGDAGEEGPDADDEELREEDLPELDADDEGELEDADLYDRSLLPDETGPVGARPVWDDRAWERAFAAPCADVRALGVGALQGALALGDGPASRAVLAFVTALGEVIPTAAAGLEGDGASAVVAIDGTWAAATSSGVFTSSDRGKTFTRANGWRGRAGDGTISLLAGRDGLWATSGDGALHFSADRGRTWTGPVLERAVVRATLDETGALAALVRSADPTGFDLVRGVHGQLSTERAPRIPRDEVIAFAARGRSLAVLAQESGVLRSRDGGAWERIEGTTKATTAAFLDGAGTLLMTLEGRVDEPGWLVKVGDDGVPRIVAELCDEPSLRTSSQARALAWDGGLAWVAMDTTVMAFRPRRRG